MDDNSLMPFGKYKDEKMANVPADYLLWLPMDILKEEVQQKNKGNGRNKN